MTINVLKWDTCLVLMVRADMNVSSQFGMLPYGAGFTKHLNKRP